MEKLMAQIMKMKQQDRVAFAHGLLMNLEKSGDITCWNFWEKETVREIANEGVETEITDEDLAGLMGRLNREWDGLAQDDWQTFSDRLNKHKKDMRIK